MNGTTLTMSPARAFATGHVNMVLQPADTSQSTPAAFIASQHNCGFWDAVTYY